MCPDSQGVGGLIVVVSRVDNFYVHRSRVLHIWWHIYDMRIIVVATRY